MRACSQSRDGAEAVPYIAWNLQKTAEGVPYRVRTALRRLEAAATEHCDQNKLACAPSGARPYFRGSIEKLARP
jgi:hypothetical protein